MKVAIIGSRDYANKNKIDQVFNTLLKKYGDNLEIVSGGARGPDDDAENLALIFCVIPPKVFHADWNGPLGKGAGFARNTQIIDYADKVIAFWDGKSNGTRDSILKTIQSKKPLFIIGDTDTEMFLFDKYK